MRRYHQRLRGRLACAVLLAPFLTLATGCATAGVGRQDRATGLARQTAKPLRVSPAAAITGATLTVENACLVGRLDDGRTMPIVWPHDAKMARDGRSVIVAGERFTIGDRLRIGGSTADSLSATRTETVGAFGCVGAYVIADTVRHEASADGPPPTPGDRARPTGKGTSFIVSCDCASVADRQRIAADARKAGANVLYVYDGFAGFAVASPAGTDPAAFAQTITRLPRVIDVRPSEELHLDANGQSRR